ncbi:MAG: adenosine deaminase [Geodermatophilaceae bacterium]
MSLISLPKAELHLHVEGTMEPELVFELAARNHVTLPFTDVEDLRDRYVFADLQSFLNLYYAAMDVLRTAADFTDLASAYLDRAHAQGVGHVEMFFDPQPHMDRGVPMEAVIDGLRAALDEAEQAGRMSGGLILCFLRDRGPDEAAAVLAAASSRLGFLIGVGLDSAEVGYPPGAFRDVYAAARGLGLHTVAHAGEEGPPAYVWEALDVLGVERIDHGIRSMEDPELVARLRRERIPLTVCPLSNVRLGAVQRLDQHPLARMLADGLMVTVNSDDPAYFGGYVSDNYEACALELGLDRNQLVLLAQNSVNASFAPEKRKAELLAQIASWTDG